MPVVTGGSSGPAPVELSAALAQAPSTALAGEPSAAPAGEPSAALAHEPSATPAPGYGIRIRNYMSFERSDNPSHLFSAGHIRQLTVQDTLELEFPQLCSSEFELLGFSDLVHEEDMLHVGELRLYIPSLNEIRSALADAPIQYGQYGKRSIRMRFRGKQLLTSEVADVLTGHIGIEYPLHFRELRRWSNAHLLHARVECVRHVLETIRHEQLLTAEECDIILQEAWDHPLRGFRDDLDGITLSHLHELLDENWLGEQLINCILELFSCQLNRHTPNLIRFLDSTFHMERRNGYCTCRASPLLTKLREEFLIDLPVIIAFDFGDGGRLALRALLGDKGEPPEAILGHNMAVLFSAACTTPDRSQSSWTAGTSQVARRTAASRETRSPCMHTVKSTTHAITVEKTDGFGFPDSCFIN